MTRTDAPGSDNLTREFVRHLRAWPAQSEALAAIARLLLIDGLAVAVAGAGEPGPRHLSALGRERGCLPGAHVIGGGFATAPELAARINGMAMHVLDFEPMWNPPNHALSTILPALLALAEKLEATGSPAQGARVLRALLKGIEAQGRLRLASRQIEPRELTLHPPGVTGPLAAAIACADLLDLGEAETAAAVGIAASQAAGLMANVGSMTKALHCGNAAMHGLEAALLAARGFTADIDALGGPRGFGQSYFGESFDPTPLRTPVTVPRVIDPGCSWKLFPSQYATHFAITAALDCRREMGDAPQVRVVTITTPVMPYIDRPQPNSGLDGKFSYQYCAAAALLDGKIDLATFSDARRFAPDMVAMLRRISMCQTPEIPGRFDVMHVDVAVTLADGRRVVQRCDGPPGSWSRPIAPEFVEAKAHLLIDDVLGPQGAQRFWDCMALPPETLRITGLMGLLSRSKAQGAAGTAAFET